MLIALTLIGSVVSLDAALSQQQTPIPPEILDRSRGAAPQPILISLQGVIQVWLPVSVMVEADGKVPVSADTRPATIHLTPVAGGNSLEAPLNSTSIAIPVTKGVIEEYSVRIEKLSEAYVVKSMTFDSTDLSAGTLKISPATLIRTVTRTGPHAFQGILSPSSLSIVLAPAR
jgi:hypothetical protein